MNGTNFAEIIEKIFYLMFLRSGIQIFLHFILYENISSCFIILNLYLLLNFTLNFVRRLSLQFVSWLFSIDSIDDLQFHLQSDSYLRKDYYKHYTNIVIEQQIVALIFEIFFSRLLNKLMIKLSKNQNILQDDISQLYMILFANNLLKKRALYVGKATNYNYIKSEQNWLFLQKNRFYSSSLKFSTFSDYMGLTQQFKQFCKNEEKQQKSQIRSYSVLIVVCVTLIGYGSLLMFYDKLLNQKLKLMKMKWKINLNFKKQNKNEVHLQCLNHISQFLEQNPYEYVQIIEKINYVLADAFATNEQTAQIVKLANKIFKIIIQHNFKATNKKQVLEGIAKIVQESVSDDLDVDKDLIMSIILNGSVKQIFLGVSYLYKQNKLDDLKNDAKIKDDIWMNLKKQVETTNKYFDHLDKSRDLSELPQFQFKQQQQQKWQEFIQAKLDIQQ